MEYRNSTSTSRESNEVKASVAIPFRLAFSFIVCVLNWFTREGGAVSFRRLLRAIHQAWPTKVCALFSFSHQEAFHEGNVETKC